MEVLYPRGLFFGSNSGILKKKRALRNASSLYSGGLQHLFICRSLSKDEEMKWLRRFKLTLSVSDGSKCTLEHLTATEAIEEVREVTW